MTNEIDQHSQVAVNIPELLARVDNDRELMYELFGIFKVEFPPLLRHLQEAVAHEDTKRVETASHALTGMLSGLSATRAAELAQQLEQMARAGETLGLADALTLFEQAVGKLLPDLEGYTTGVEL